VVRILSMEADRLGKQLLLRIQSKLVRRRLCKLELNWRRAHICRDLRRSTARDYCLARVLHSYPAMALQRTSLRARRMKTRRTRGPSLSLSIQGGYLT